MTKRWKPGEPMRGAGQCPKCGCRKVARATMPQIAVYGGPVEICINCGAIWETFDPGALLDEGERYSSFREPCNNCAFRSGSPEQQNGAQWRDLMAKLKAGTGQFYCHKGVPIDPASEDGFDYPKNKSNGLPDRRRLRPCRGYLQMLCRMRGRRLEHEAPTP